MRDWRACALGVVTGWWLACADAQPEAATPELDVRDGASACPRTRACGGDAVGAWRIVSMCTRAPELLFDVYTHAPDARCRAEIRAAELSAQGRLEVAASLAIDLDYTLAARLDLAWPARCLTDDGLSGARCDEVQDALREHGEVEGADCQVHDAECSCEVRVTLQVQAQNVDRARDVFAAGEHCVAGQRLRLEDGSASLLLERASTAR